MDLERQLIGSLLIFPKSFFNIKLNPDDLNPKFRKVYNCIAEMLRSGEEVNVITVSEASGVDMMSLNNFTKLAVSSVTARSAAEAITKRARSAVAVQGLEQAIRMVKDGSTIGSVMSDLSQVLTEKIESKTLSLDEAIGLAIDQAREFEKTKDAVVKTGLPSLDRMLKLRGGKLFVIAGRPGGFKSAFALKILKSTAEAGQGAGIISLEMGSEENADRFLKMAGVQANLSNGLGIENAVQARSQFNNLPLYINSTVFDFHKIEATIVEMVERFKCKVVIIDYLQLIAATGGKSGWERLGELTRSLKLLAMRLDIPIGILSQLNRQCEIENRKPKLSDLRESGSIEQDADAILFLHKEVLGDKENFYLIVGKQRGGATGEISLSVDKPKFQLTEAYKDHNH